MTEQIKTPAELDRERAEREEAGRAKREAAALTQGLKTELGAMRIRHARAVAKVAALERGYTPDFAGAVVAALGGRDGKADHLGSLQMWRVKRDIAAESVRYLEGRLGTVNINES